MIFNKKKKIKAFTLTELFNYRDIKIVIITVF